MLNPATRQWTYSGERTIKEACGVWNIFWTLLMPRMVIRCEGVVKTTQQQQAAVYGKPISYKLRRSASIEYITYLPNNILIILSFFLLFFLLLPPMNDPRLRAEHNNGPAGRDSRRKEKEKKYVTKFIRVNRAKRFYALWVDCHD